MDSAATVQTIKDRHSHADHFTQKRMFPALELDSFQLITVIRGTAIFGKLL